MYSTVTVEKYSIFLGFAALGFKTVNAVVNICLDLDASIAVWEIDVFWRDGICTQDFETKINGVLERLKTE